MYTDSETLPNTSTRWWVHNPLAKFLVFDGLLPDEELGSMLNMRQVFVMVLGLMSLTASLVVLLLGVILPIAVDSIEDEATWFVIGAVINCFLPTLCFFMARVLRTPFGDVGYTLLVCSMVTTNTIGQITSKDRFVMEPVNVLLIMTLVPFQTRSCLQCLGWLFTIAANVYLSLCRTHWFKGYFEAANELSPEMWFPIYILNVVIYMCSFWLVLNFYIYHASETHANVRITVRAAQVFAENIANMDTESATLTIEDYQDWMDPKMTAAFNRINENMKIYLPYIQSVVLPPMPFHRQDPDGGDGSADIDDPVSDTVVPATSMPLSAGNPLSGSTDPNHGLVQMLAPIDTNGTTTTTIHPNHVAVIELTSVDSSLTDDKPPNSPRVTTATSDNRVTLRKASFMGSISTTPTGSSSTAVHQAKGSSSTHLPNFVTKEVLSSRPSVDDVNATIVAIHCVHDRMHSNALYVDDASNLIDIISEKAARHNGVFHYMNATTAIVSFNTAQLVKNANNCSANFLNDARKALQKVGWYSVAAIWQGKVRVVMAGTTHKHLFMTGPAIQELDVLLEIAKLHQTVTASFAVSSSLHGSFRVRQIDVVRYKPHDTELMTTSSLYSTSESVDLSTFQQPSHGLTNSPQTGGVVIASMQGKMTSLVVFEVGPRSGNSATENETVEWMYRLEQEQDVASIFEEVFQKGAYGNYDEAQELLDRLPLSISQTSRSVKLIEKQLAFCKSAKRSEYYRKLFMEGMGAVNQ